MKPIKTAFAGIAAAGLVASVPSFGATRSASATTDRHVAPADLEFDRAAVPVAGASDLSAGVWFLILLALAAGGYGFYQAVKSDSNG